MVGLTIHVKGGTTHLWYFGSTYFYFLYYFIFVYLLLGLCGQLNKANKTLPLTLLKV